MYPPGHSHGYIVLTQQPSDSGLYYTASGAELRAKSVIVNADPFTMLLEPGTFAAEWFSIEARQTVPADPTTIDCRDNLADAHPELHHAVGARSRAGAGPRERRLGSGALRDGGPARRATPTPADRGL